MMATGRGIRMVGFFLLAVGAIFGVGVGWGILMVVGLGIVTGTLQEIR